MDLINTKRNAFNLNIEKKAKRRKELNKTILSQNNNRENLITEEINEELPQKSLSYLKLSLEPKLIEEQIYNPLEFSIEEKCNKDIEKSNSNKLLNDFWFLLSKSLKLSIDFIHERYVAYSNQSQAERDATKTEYSYAFSYSYNNRIDISKISDWSVPNMSRKSVSSVKSLTQSTKTSSTFSKVEMSTNSNTTSTDLISNIGSENVGSLTSAQLNDSRSTQMFTRSHCLGGNQCEAGCEIHKKVRRRAHKSNEIVIPHSGNGLEPQYEFSDDDDYALNNSMNDQKYNTYKLNGRYHREVSDDEEEEDITYVRRVTKIFRTTINNTSKFIDSFTPNKKKSLFPLLLLLLALFGASAYIKSQYFSSPLSDSSLEGLTSDLSSNIAINQIVKELKIIKDDLKNLKNSNNDMKSQLSNNEFDGNEKYNKLNNKVESIEDLLINVLKNCCKNETDQMLALIDSRLAAFMSLMLSQNKNGKQSLTPSEAAIELKSYIQSELSQTNQILKEDIEEKLMSAIERIEEQLNQSPNSNSLSSNITIEEIKSLIGEALAMYDADKTGQPDFALEPAGGTVINTRCSETFDPHGVQYRILGMPVWSSSVSPRAVIQPTITPGECWAFRGSNGYLVIKLSQLIVPTAFSYEHIPKQISRDGNINSAPKEFQVRGLDDESDTKGHLLGNYVYEDNNKPMQHFIIQDPNPKPYQFIELVILSNHGHDEYTCLYRFRVHGKRVNY